ncbi:MAG: hypothetical protein ABW082_11585 [Sedimenticola sp.]
MTSKTGKAHSALANASMLPSSVIPASGKSIARCDDGASRKLNPEGKRLHWRVSVNDSVVTVNSAVDQVSKPRSVHYDLKQYGLIPPDAISGGGAHPQWVPLTEFPHYCAALIELCDDLARKHGKNFIGTGSRNVRNVLRWLHFFSMRGKYRLQDVTISDIEYAVNNLDEGFFSLLDIEGKCKDITHYLKEDDRNNLSHVITPKSRLTPVLKLKKGAVSVLLGVPWDGNKIPLPNGFLDDLRDLYCARNPDYEGAVSPKRIGPMAATKDSLSQVLSALNLLNQFPDEIDRIPFLPVAAPNKYAAQLAKRKTAQRTSNVSLEDAIKLLETALKWIYDYGPTVVRLAADYRKTLETRWLHLTKKGARSANDCSNEQDLAPPFLERCFKAQRKGKFPDLEICAINSHPRSDQRVTDGMYCYRDIIDTLMTSCFVVIAFNNARRKNEVSGEYKNYGLHYGCVEEVDAVLSYATIEFYVEKTLQDYRTFTTNQLTVDAVHLLEELYWVFEPFGAKRRQLSRQKVEDARQRKIFTLCNLTKHGLNPNTHERFPFIFGNHSTLFFELAGVDAEGVLRRTHIFRRLFSLIYLYRFKDARIEALSLLLCHLDYAQTQVYVTDPEMRRDAESIERLYRQCKAENAYAEEAMEEVRLELSREMIKEMIDGTTAGGMAKRVRNLHKRMLKSIKPVKGNKLYGHMSDGEKVTFLADVYKRHKQAPDPRKHGACWADSHHNGQCRDDATGKLARENAAPKKCRICAYHSFSKVFIANLEVDLESLEADAKNYEIPTAQRLGARKAARNLRALINLEHAMVDELQSL